MLLKCQCDHQIISQVDQAAAVSHHAISVMQHHVFIHLYDSPPAAHAMAHGAATVMLSVMHMHTMMTHIMTLEGACVIRKCSGYQVKSCSSLIQR